MVMYILVMLAIFTNYINLFNKVKYPIGKPLHHTLEQGIYEMIPKLSGKRLIRYLQKM